MDKTKFRDAYHEAILARVARLTADYFDIVDQSKDPEDKRKALVFAVQTAGLEAEKKADVNAGLPVFHFNFVNGGVQATVQTSGAQTPARQDDVVDMETAPAALPLNPSPKLLAAAAVNADLEGLEC